VKARIYFMLAKFLLVITISCPKSLAEEARSPDMVARWECAGPGSVLWRDVTGNGWNGEIYGGKVCGSQPHLLSLQLSRNDFVEVPLRGHAWPDGAWTLMLWLNLAREQHARRPSILSLGKSWLVHITDCPPFRLASNVNVRVGERVKLFQAASQPNLEPGRWYHIAVVVQPSRQRLYVNGKLVRMVKTEGLPAVRTDVLRIGDRDTGKDEGINGLIGSVTLYERAVEDADVSAVCERDAEQWRCISIEDLERPKRVTNFAFVRMRSGAMEFGISRAGGFVRNLRWAPQPALIEYVSLSEGAKQQIALQGSQWEVDWAGRGLEVVHGREVAYSGSPPEPGWELPSWLRGTPLLLLKPKENALKLLARGCLSGAWRQTLSYQKAGPEDRMSWRWERTPSARREPIEVTIQLMRWVHNFEVPLLILHGSGGAHRVDTDWSALKSGDELVMYAWHLGREIRARLGCDCDARRTVIRRFAGGWGIALRPRSPEHIVDFGMEMRFLAMPRFSTQTLDGVVHSANGAVWLQAGGMPLLGVEGFQGDRLQSLAGLSPRDKWQVDVDPAHPTRALVAARGTLGSGMQFGVTARDRALSFQWRKLDASDVPAGCHLAIPYEWVGSRMVIVRPEGTEIKGLNGVPLRAGADMDLGRHRRGTQLIIYPTATERVAIRLDAGFHVISYRRQFASTEPFRELVPFKHAYSPDVADAEVIELHAPAGLVLAAGRGASDFGFTVSYERTVTDAAFPTPAIEREEPENTLPVLKVYRDTPDKGDVTVATPWWRVVHRRRDGGAISEIVFPQGSTRNILLAPLASYARIDGQTYVHNRDPSATIRIASADAQDVEVTSSGVLRPETDTRTRGHLGYRCTYHYTPWWLKRTVEFDFGATGQSVTRIGVLRIDARPELDEIADKPCVVRWQKAVFPGPTVAISRSVLPSGVLLFQRGVEGIGFMPDSNMRAWQRQATNRPDSAYTAVEANTAGGPRLIVEPLRTESPVRVRGTLRYTHYLGLPCVRKYLPRIHRPCYLGFNRWATRDVLQRLGDDGVNLLMVGFSDGGFGYFVPTDPTTREGAARFIRLAHERGIRTVPFTAPSLPLKRLPPACKENFDQWVILKARGTDLKPLEGPTWYYFCFEAPKFREFLKRGFTRTLKEFAFDGLYCDGFYPMGPCYNASHGPAPHACWDGLLAFARWTRESLLGPGKVLWAHTGYYPTFIIDNMCNMTWIFEEVNYWCNKEGRVCSLDRISEMAEVVPNTQRVLDVTPVDRWMTYRGEKIGNLHWDAQDVKAYMARLVLCGLFSTAASARTGPRSVDDLFMRLHGHLRLARTFRDFDLSKFRFANWRAQSAAVPDTSAVRCAVYWNPHEALVVVSNPECRDPVQCRLRVLPGAFGWSRSVRYDLREIPNGRPEVMLEDALTKRGVELRLDGFDYKVLHLKPRRAF